MMGKRVSAADVVIRRQPLGDPQKETKFENCVADVNIPVGEVFTSPVLKGTQGVLHVSKVYLHELQYLDLRITFEDGMIRDYTCANFENEEDNRKYVYDNVLHQHETLPTGEFAIRTLVIAGPRTSRFIIRMARKSSRGTIRCPFCERRTFPKRISSATRILRFRMRN